MRPTGAVGAEPRQLDAFVQLLREHHRLLDREARRLLQLARDERRRRVALALLGRDRRDDPARAFELGEDGVRLLLVADADRLAVLLEQLRLELGRLRTGQPAKMFQYSSGTNFSISRSRSQTSFSATDCTRPALSPRRTLSQSSGLIL